jgi:hypothetical protein
MLNGIRGTASGSTSPSAKSDRLTVNRGGKSDIQARSLKSSDRIGQADVLMDVSVTSQSVE